MIAPNGDSGAEEGYFFFITRGLWRDTYPSASLNVAVLLFPNDDDGSTRRMWVQASRFTEVGQLTR